MVSFLCGRQAHGTASLANECPSNMQRDEQDVRRAKQQVFFCAHLYFRKQADSAQVTQPQMCQHSRARRPVLRRRSSQASSAPPCARRLRAVIFLIARLSAKFNSRSCAAVRFQASQPQRTPISIVSRKTLSLDSILARLRFQAASRA